MLPLMLMVPELTALRKVPALSKRLTPELKENEEALRASNSAPGPLVITAEPKAIVPAPVHSIVPWFSRVRVVNDTVPALLRVAVVPAGIRVRPLPLMAPPDQ